MFTGLIEALGEVVELVTPPRRPAGGQADALIRVRAPFAAELGEGESVAVNGVCLTVTGVSQGVFSANLMPETVRMSTLGSLLPHTRVNLERALRADARLGGHIVQGHVDGVGRILRRQPGERWDDITLTLPAAVAPYVAYKGSIAIEGVSLTVSGVGREWARVSLIPQTLEATTLGSLSEGARVNIETDMLARYLQRLSAFGPVGTEPEEVQQ